MLHIEPLTGGLVTARDATLLGEGELTRADNGIYRPFVQAIGPLRDRAQFGDTVGASISGLRAIPFETETTYVIIAHGTKWQTNPLGVWTDLRTGVTAGARLEAVHYERSGAGGTGGTAYFVSNGVDSPSAVGAGGGPSTIITHGMTPNDSNDWTVAVAAGGGEGWETIGLGFRGYWITEYNHDQDLESASVAPIASQFVEITEDDDTVTVTIPYGGANYLTKHNAGADRWRIYRALEPLDVVLGVGAQPGIFPFGVLVGEISIPGSPATTTFDDTGIPSDTPYPSITVSVAGAGALSFSMDTPPPDWSTGDVFEDSLVVNDVDEPAIIRYSFPGRPHSFPTPYFIGFSTRQRDTVTCLRSVGETLIAGLKSQIWRINYLPLETDSDFNRGRVRQLISPNHGIMGPDGACVFAPVDGAPKLAYVSHDGLYMTDGFNTQMLTQDLDWDTLVNKDELDTALLVNVHHLWSLFFYYNAPSTTFPNNRLLILSYHPQHLKDGRFLKVAGPASLTTRAADYNSQTFAALAADTNVFTEDVTDAGTVVTAQTRLIYPREGSLDTETTIHKVRVLTGPYTAGTHNIALRRRQSDSDIATDASVSYTPDTGENRLVTADLHGLTEAFGALINTSATVHYVGFEHKTRGSQ